MDKKYDVIIADVYNIFYRFNFIENEEKIVTVDGQKIHTEGIIAFLKALEIYKNKFAKENTRIYLCFDNADTLFERHDISDRYKLSRIQRQPKEWFYKELDYCELISRYYDDGFYIIRANNYEADDYVKNIIENFTTKKDNILMISEDLDWARFISDNVVQYMKHAIWTKEKFIEEFDFEPTESNLGFYKSFNGDKSDDILPALSNFPKVYFKDVISKYTDMKDFVMDVKKGILDYLDKGWKLKVEENELDLLTNFNLIKSAKISDSELCGYIHKSKYQPNKLRIIYSALDILGRIDDRIKPIVKDTNLFDMLNGERLER